MTSPQKILTLPHFSWQGRFLMWQGHFIVWQSHFKVWQSHFPTLQKLCPCHIFSMSLPTNLCLCHICLKKKGLPFSFHHRPCGIVARSFSCVAMSFFFYDLATIENDLATRFYDLATRNLSLPPKPWQGHFLLWQIHRFCVLGHFLPHDSFRAKVRPCHTF